MPFSAVTWNRWNPRNPRCSWEIAPNFDGRQNSFRQSTQYRSIQDMIISLPSIYANSILHVHTHQAYLTSISKKKIHMFHIFWHSFWLFLVVMFSTCSHSHDSHIPSFVKWRRCWDWPRALERVQRVFRRRLCRRPGHANFVESGAKCWISMAICKYIRTYRQTDTQTYIQTDTYVHIYIYM